MSPWESPAHVEAKISLCQWLTRHGVEAFMEYPLPSRHEGWFRSGDVVVPDHHTIFEIETSNATHLRFHWRADDLEAMGWRVIPIFTGREPGQCPRCQQRIRFKPTAWQRPRKETK